MNNIVITDVNIAKEFIEKTEKEEMEKKRSEHIVSIENFTKNPSSRVKVIQHLNECFSWDEILLLSDHLIEKGYVVVTARGYFCIEIPCENGRKPGVYCGDTETLKTYIGYGISAHDITTKAPNKDVDREDM